MAPSVAINCATHNGTRADIWPLVSAAEAIFLAVLPVTHPPQENPITKVARTPIAIPCSRRERDSPDRIDGTCMASAFRSEGARRRQRTDRHARVFVRWS